MYCNYRVLIIDELLQEKFVQLSDSPVFLGPVGIGSRRVAAMQLGRTMALLMAWLMRSRQCPDTGLDTKYIYISGLGIPGTEIPNSPARNWKMTG